MKRLITAFAIFLVCSHVAHAQQQPGSHDVTNEAIFALGGFGYTGRTTAAYKEMNEMVRTKNVAKLSTWLYSENPVIRLYALEGYKRLNTELDAFTHDLISSVLKSKEKVSVGGGCMVMSTSLQEVAKQQGYFLLLKK